MPDDADTTTPVVEETAAPAPYTFPFEVPVDLAGVSDEDLRNLHSQVRDHARTFAGLSPAETTADTLAALEACRDLAVSVTGELVERRDRSDAAAATLAELEELELPLPADVVDVTDEDPADEPALEPEPVLVPAVTAAAPRRPAPRVRDVARGTRAPALPVDTQTPAFATLTAASDLGGFSTGQTLARFADAAKILSARLDQYPSIAAPKRYPPTRRPVTVYVEDEPGRQFTLKNYSRHPGVELRRDFPAELRVREGDSDRRGYAVAEFAAQERRLPGGSLIESQRLSLTRGRSLTAAAGWCAPSETMYDLLEMETLDGILDAPELQTSRGGWQIPDNGGPDFASLWDGWGNAGDTHLTEAEVIADTEKVCTEIPCPDFSDVRLGVDYVCITGSLLQRRGYPEVVARFGRAAVIALAHKMNQGFISAIVAGSGAPTIIGSDAAGDDAASSLLSAVDLAITDAKYRNRMSFTGTMEVVLPWWTLVKIRAGLARRAGVAMLSVSNAQILEWFAERGAVVRLVYDWQDAYSGVATGPGGATPLAALPATVQFLVYPAGTWVRAVQDVVNLDSIYDSTLLTTNQYTALFAETGWAALKMSPISRLYTVPIDASGVVGCCPGEEVS